MEDKYWSNFYKKGKQEAEGPSSFVTWLMTHRHLFNIEEDSYVLELGAGSGRDVPRLRNIFRFVKAVDKAVETNDRVYNMSLTKALKLVPGFDIIYSRFFLHCLTKKEIASLIGHISKDTFFVAEFRVKGDKPILYTNHKRHFVDMNWLLSILINSGFEIKFSQVSKDLAKFKDENPLIGRIVAYKYVK